MRRRHVMPFGAELKADGCEFTLWAPSAAEIVLVLDGDEHQLDNRGRGWRGAFVPGVGPGSRYRYRTAGLDVPDPASRFQPDDVKGPSVVVDPAAYSWQDSTWRGRPWEEAVISEIHVGTATPEGTFAALSETLEGLRDIGVTAVELMPLGDFSGRRNWGYDGVLLFAPDSAYGTPGDLKALVDHAHELGIMMFLDVVYNHFGPDGNYLPVYADKFFTDRHKTPWGSGLNFDGEVGRIVRDFFIHNALYWLEEYHFDGLRLDAVHAILDDSDPHIIAELAETVRQSLPGRQIHLVLENERNEARWLTRDGEANPALHTAQWNDDIHHCWHTLLTGESDAYYEDFADRPVERLGRCLAEGFAYQGDPSTHDGGKSRGEPSAHLPPSAFIAFLQNHDQIGNRAFGERLTELVPASRLRLARAALLLSPQIPMLFMGEEWGARTPFQFFVDYPDEPELSDAIREGRRREFRKFAAFSDPQAALSIPDPTEDATFRRSVLALTEADEAPFRSIRDETRHLIGLRREYVVPLTKSAYLGASVRSTKDGLLDVVWRFEGRALRLVANFGEAEAQIAPSDADQVLWQSDDARLDGDRVALTAWTGLFATSPAP